MNQRKSTRSRRPSTITVVLISDTHELHCELDMPAGDLLIHAGDITMFSRSLPSIIDFNDWLGELPYKNAILVPGNHDTFIETDPGKRSLLSNATVLINESVNLCGLRVWGSPVTKTAPAFCIPSGDERRLLYAGIPDGIDVLITHGPPFGILDRSPGSDHRQGDPELLAAVLRVQPKLHVFGHVHMAGAGIVKMENTTFVNAAVLRPDGGIRRSPIVLQMKQE